MSVPRPGRLRALLLVLAVLGLAGWAVPAHAASPSLPDPSKTGAINIHKFQAPNTPTGLPNNGTVQSTTGLTPVPGVTFSIQQVTGIDLTTNQGWQNANTLSGTFNPASPSASITSAGYGLSTATGSPVTTSSTGDASLSNLPLGLYLVTETSYPAGTTPSAPFLVSVPLTNPADQASWLYNVNVYPKNSVDNVTKTVVDASAVKLGDPVTWTIKGDIPNVSTIDGYKITDTLDPKLDYVGATVALADGTTITLGTDYTVNFDAPSRTLTVQFTASGRAIMAAHNATQVVVTLTTKANAVGEIPNVAVLFPNASSFGVLAGQPGGPVASAPVFTKWGNVTVQKTGPTGTALSGAVFSVYATQADAAAGTNPITIGGASTFAVDATGQVTIAGLRYSDFANGASVASGTAGYRDYYLGEVKAPTGYELLAQPIKFQVNATTTAVGVDLTVKDVPSNAGFTLPFTGGPGILLYYLGGAMLLAGAVLMSGSRRTRRTTSALG